MTIEKYSPQNGKIARRKVLKGLLATGVATLFGGCVEPGEGPSYGAPQRGRKVEETFKPEDGDYALICRDGGKATGMIIDKKGPKDGVLIRVHPKITKSCWKETNVLEEVLQAEQEIYQNLFARNNGQRPIQTYRTGDQEFGSILGKFNVDMNAEYVTPGDPRFNLQKGFYFNVKTGRIYQEDVSKSGISKSGGAIETVGKTSKEAPKSASRNDGVGKGRAGGDGVGSGDSTGGGGRNGGDGGK